MLAGKQVVLRPFRPDDLPAIYRVASDLDTWAARSRRGPQPLTYEAFRDWYVPATAGIDGAEFVIEAEGAPVGRCGMFGEDTFAHVAEVGIALLPEARGQGYGTDALRVLVGFLFKARNLQRLHLETLASNAAAIASYAKVGFVREGVLRSHAFADGKYVDTVMMGLLRSEWAG
ncbi:MAG: GNAT family N-acetyltransferase [Pseudonocardiales bacterium]|nr:MAG: GNAT family N-acetyltransferase [Pseudonocardiales bacterium]